MGLPLLHAVFRLPNLKAKIASAREEFRAVWWVGSGCALQRGDLPARGTVTCQLPDEPRGCVA